jgi:hypothetical protein
MKQRLSALFAGVMLIGGLMAAPASAAAPAAALGSDLQAKGVATSVPGPLPKRLPPAEEKAAQARAQAKADAKLAKAATLRGYKAPVKGKAPTKSGAATGGSDSVSLMAGPYFFYNVAQSSASPAIAGGSDNIAIRKPYLDTTDDYHTLAELAVSKAGTGNIVEVGFNVDTVVNGNADPHVFVFNWTAHTPGCYNACGWVPYGTGIQAGDNINGDVGLSKFMEIQHFSGAWWIAYGGSWMGYFPDSDWAGSTFTSIDFTQVFGEVAAGTTTPCTDMGNGVLGNSSNTATAAKLGSYTQVPNVSNNVLTGPSSVPNTIPTNVYVSYAQSARTFVYGGPGWNSAGTGAGTTGSC